MPTLSDLNTLVTLALSVAVIGIAACRVFEIDPRKVQYRYIAPILLAGSLAIFIFFTAISGDRPDYYMPIALLGFLVFMWNNRQDWANGVPAYMLRAVAVIKNERWPGNIVQRLKFENFMVGAVVVFSIGATGAGALDSGDPLIVYSVHAEPRVVTSNGTVDIVYSFRRSRLCSGYVDRFIVRAGTEQAVQKFDPTPVGASKIGVRIDGFRVKVSLDNLPPGNYIYRATVTHYCEDSAAPYIKRTPDVPFIVSPEPAK